MSILVLLLASLVCFVLGLALLLTAAFMQPQSVYRPRVRFAGMIAVAAWLLLYAGSLAIEMLAGSPLLFDMILCGVAIYFGTTTLRQAFEEYGCY